MPVMFRHVIWVDEYIIQIDHSTNIQQVREEVIYKSLEDYKSIGKTKVLASHYPYNLQINLEGA